MKQNGRTINSYFIFIIFENSSAKQHMFEFHLVLPRFSYIILGVSQTPNTENY